MERVPGVSDVLLRQFDLAWALAMYHIDTLTTEECLRRPAVAGLHVIQDAAGSWVAEWPASEAYDIGPPSAAWVTWHMLFWWSMVLDHSFGDATLRREDVRWPGSADGVRAALRDCADRWRSRVAALDDVALASSGLSRWPLAGVPFADIVAWANVELAKNAAELGYARFVLAVQRSG